MAGILQFHGLPRRTLEAGALADRLEPPEQYEHLRATPEKALLDRLYLGRSARSHVPLPAPGDIDMGLLNGNRLRRLAKAAQLADVLARWQQQD